MGSKVLFASSSYAGYDADATLPAKFDRLIDKTELKDKVWNKAVAIKMHVGREIGYTTIHPLFIKKLVDKLKEYGAKPFVTDHIIEDARHRGYTEEFLGCPIVAVNGHLDKYFYPVEVDYRSFKHVDIAGHIRDADFLIDLSHVKGHGACGYGGACKNIAMGCVTDRTRRELHALEGGIEWDETTCTHCEACVKSCNHGANSFAEGKYKMFYHHCTLCQHCVKVCPTGSLSLTSNHYDHFQAGMALCTKTILDSVGLSNTYYINFLTNITALCDCWGLSTPSLVPDIGILASSDIVAVERASLDAIKIENLLVNGVPEGFELGTEGHLFQRLHARDPFVQLRELEKAGLGTENYEIVEIG